MFRCPGRIKLRRSASVCWLLIIALAVFGPAAGFALSMSVEYSDAIARGGDRFLVAGATLGSDLKTPHNDPWVAVWAAHALRSGADHLGNSLVNWVRSTDLLEAILTTMLWLAAPAGAALAGVLLVAFARPLLIFPNYTSDPGLRPTLCPALRSAAFRSLTVAGMLLPLAGYIAGQRHLLVGSGDGLGHAHGIPTYNDLAVACAVAAAVAAFIALVVQARVIRCSVTESTIRCKCGYPVPINSLPRCPECAANAPALPARLWIAGVSSRRWAEISIGLGLAIGIASALSVAGFFPVRQPMRALFYGATGNLGHEYQLRTRPSDTLMLRMQDGDALIVVSFRPFFPAVPAFPGRLPASPTALSGRLRCACAYWPRGAQVGSLDQIHPFRGDWLLGNKSAHSFEAACGPHNLRLSVGLADPGFVTVSTVSQIIGFDRVRRDSASSVIQDAAARLLAGQRDRYESDLASDWQAAEPRR